MLLVLLLHDLSHHFAEFLVRELLAFVDGVPSGIVSLDLLRKCAVQDRSLHRHLGRQRVGRACGLDDNVVRRDLCIICGESIALFELGGDSLHQLLLRHRCCFLGGYDQQSQTLMPGAEGQGQLHVRTLQDSVLDGRRIGILAVDEHNNIALSADELPLGFA